jgi:alkylation response protein AidB-like acyl-CoA dehydrogenase
MELTLNEQERQLRDDVHDFLAANAPSRKEIPVDWTERVAFLRAWQKQMHEAGLVAISWPKEFGGRGASVMEQVVVNQEIARAGAPELIGTIGLDVVGPSIVAHGTDEQKQRYLEPIMAGEELWCQGFSEPNAGSDLASLATVAEVHDDHFVIRGQKTWTSYAEFAKWCAVLARTDPDSKGHRGISYICVDLESKGVDARPLALISGDTEFGEVFFEDVVVPRTNLIGELDQGWAIAMHTLGHERGSYAATRQVMMRTWFDRLVEEAAQLRRGETTALEDPQLAATITRAFVELEVLKHHGYRSLGRDAARGGPGPESSEDKLFLGTTEHRVGAAALDVLGPYASGNPEVDDHDAAFWHHMYLYGRAASVYGGTAQIQRNIIAQRVLGLPRS